MRKLSKKELLLSAMLVWAGSSLTSYGQGTVWLNNYGYAPLPYQGDGFLSGDDADVIVLAGPSPERLAPVTIRGTTNYALPLVCPGYFDGGVGVVSNVAEGQVAAFQIQARKNLAVGEMASTLLWVQTTGTAERPVHLQILSSSTWPLVVMPFMEWSQIVRNPIDQVVSAGDDVVFTVQVQPFLPGFYQWMRDGQVLPGATNSSLLLPDVTVAQTGGYSVGVNNGMSWNPTMSRTALLWVNPPTGPQSFDYFVHRANGTGAFITDRPLAPPAKGEWLTNALFNTPFVRVSDVNADGVGNYMASVVYSRWTPANSSGQLLYLQRTVGGPDALIYSATNFDLLKILPAQITIDDVPDQPFSSMEANEIRWDCSGNYPNRFYFVEASRFYQYDLLNDTAHLLHDFTNQFPNAEIVQNGVEGDSSADSRYWAWMVRGPDAGEGAPVLALITYDRETDRITGKLDLARYQQYGGQYSEVPVPNMVEISPSGRKVIYHLGRCWGAFGVATNWTWLGTSNVFWTTISTAGESVTRVEEQDTGRQYRGLDTYPSKPGTYYFDREAGRLYVRCSDSLTPLRHTIAWDYGNRPREIGTIWDGPHAWDLDFSRPFKVSVDETHSGWASHPSCREVELDNFTFGFLLGLSCGWIGAG
jgi:hypothetical protein